MRAWLLDVYPDAQDGLVVWLLGEDGRRRRCHQPFPITFYAAGPFPRLRAAWRYLRAQPTAVHLSRTVRRDLFSGEVEVLAAEVTHPAEQPRLLQKLLRRFPDLDYYDVDIPLALRFGVAYDLFPLAYCEVDMAENGRLHTIHPLESRWALEPTPPPLRTLIIAPNCDPAHAPPTHLHIRHARGDHCLPIRPYRLLLIQLQAMLRRYDPDILLTGWGDTWLFPLLLEAAQAEGFHDFNPNRDPSRRVLRRDANSYFTYGQVVYRGAQAHLFGRWHIDQRNAMMFGDYGLDGVLEQARVTGLPVQEVARKSPGAGITAMQMQTALREGVLVPYQKQQTEGFKSARDLIRADRGGLVYQPTVGLHHGVAEIDFVSMYPSIMVHFNVSPETIGVPGEHRRAIPELGLSIDPSREGLVPQTLRPLLARRIAIKQQLAGLNRRDCRYAALKARADALKWLLVVCFGYLGYKNARFGRIESHEAVTAYGREALLRAKEAAEDLGYTVLHMYVDGLWVQRPDLSGGGSVQPLLDEIVQRTGLPIALEGIYRWVAFLPSRLDERVPIANRYFGAFVDGRLKTRGIAARRHDTAPFVAETQLAILQRLAAVPDGQPLASALPDVLALLRQRAHALRGGRIPAAQLLVSQRLSRTLDEYRTPSPAARAAGQLAAVGKERRPGQRIRFVYTRGEPGVCAWDLPEVVLETAVIDAPRYLDLLARAAHAILQPLGVDEQMLRDWLRGDAYQLSCKL
ncbi:MAG: hypothetical protein IPG51_08290 [Chloroflexi bacterium]|nr:hypothetical protein [Chloroflexota bacterium]